MTENRKSILLLTVPFAVLSLATLLLFYVADQTLEALHSSMHFSDVWMEADRSALTEISRCLGMGGADCGPAERQLQKPLAYVRATRERAKARPDDDAIEAALRESGIDASPFRFRMHWFERIPQMLGLNIASGETDIRLRGGLPHDLQGILDLSQRAREARNRVPPNQGEIAALQRNVEKFAASLEKAKSAFDIHAGQALSKLRKIIYSVVIGAVSAMFAVALWFFRWMLKSYRAKEAALLDREKDLSRDLAHSVNDLQKALSDRTVLLQEVQHRVKNNLAVVYALLNLEADRAHDSGAINVLGSVRDRVRSMAFVHERLSHDGTSSELDAQEYVDALAQHLFKSFATADKAIDFHSKVEAFLSLEQSVPCGLIINELLTNSLKHAFKDRLSGNIWIDLSQSESETKLTYRDDGAGLPPNFDLSQSPSLGMHLISDLVTQLNGTSHWGGTNGLLFELAFHSPRAPATAKMVARV